MDRGAATTVRAEANRTEHGIKFDGRTGDQTNGGRV